MAKLLFSPNLTGAYPLHRHVTHMDYGNRAAFRLAILLSESSQNRRLLVASDSFFNRFYGVFEPEKDYGTLSAIVKKSPHLPFIDGGLESVGKKYKEGSPVSVSFSDIFATPVGQIPETNQLAYFMSAFVQSNMFCPPDCTVYKAVQAIAKGDKKEALKFSYEVERHVVQLNIALAIMADMDAGHSPAPFIQGASDAYKRLELNNQGAGSALILLANQFSQILDQIAKSLHG